MFWVENFSSAKGMAPGKGRLRQFRAWSAIYIFGRKMCDWSSNSTIMDYFRRLEFYGMGDFGSVTHELVWRLFGRKF